MLFKIAAPVLLAASALAQTFSVSTPVRPDQTGDKLVVWARADPSRPRFLSAVRAHRDQNGLVADYKTVPAQIQITGGTSPYIL
jgi:hypothetical protein